MSSSKIALAAAVILGTIIAAGRPAAAAIIYADNLVNSSHATPFGSGLVTGARDGGGMFLGSTLDPPAQNGFIEVEFLTSLVDGPGADLQVLDREFYASDPWETADVFVSTDGISFTFVGSIIGGYAEGHVDFNPVYAAPVNFVRVAQTSTFDSIDIDALQGNYHTPEPSTFMIWSLLAVLATTLGWYRRRTAA